MKIDGTYSIAAPREKVWEHLLNPKTLAKCLPGCEKLEPQTDGSYLTEMNVGIAAVKGRYHGRVEILDAVAPEKFRMKVEGKGAGGFIKGEGILTLVKGESDTLVGYTGEAQVGGVIACVGQRLVVAAARQIVQKFFQEFAKQVAS